MLILLVCFSYDFCFVLQFTILFFLGTQLSLQERMMSAWKRASYEKLIFQSQHLFLLNPCRWNTPPQNASCQGSIKERKSNLVPKKNSKWIDILQNLNLLIQNHRWTCLTNLAVKKVYKSWLLKSLTFSVWYLLLDDDDDGNISLITHILKTRTNHLKR